MTGFQIMKVAIRRISWLLRVSRPAPRMYVIIFTVRRSTEAQENVTMVKKTAMLKSKLKRRMSTLLA